MTTASGLHLLSDADLAKLGWFLQEVIGKETPIDRSTEKLELISHDKQADRVVDTYGAVAKSQEEKDEHIAKEAKKKERNDRADRLKSDQGNKPVTRDEFNDLLLFLEIKE